MSSEPHIEDSRKRKAAEGSSEGRNEHTQRKKVPDHGKHFVPGAGDSSQAPEALDHFKRGYRERALMRDKEIYRSSRHDDREFKTEGMVSNLDTGRVLDDLASQRRPLDQIMNDLRNNSPEAFESGKAMTAIIAAAARRRMTRVAHQLWDWMDKVRLPKSLYHYNSFISVMEKEKNFQGALDVLGEMESRNITKNEVTFSSAISACEKCGKWRIAIDLLDRMQREGVGRTAIAYNAAISACEKGIVPQKAFEIFQRMKAEGIEPSVVSFSALISAAEKGGQWKLALEVLEDMERAGYRCNVVAYSATISALARGQQWQKALELFRVIQSTGASPSIITYNATMTALEKSMQFERALGLFEEMKMRNLPITVVSYGSAIAACDKGLQYRQCLEYLDEMSDMGISKNVIIFGAAMSCMEKCCRADISFQLMDRMKMEGISPNVHIYNSAISACARCSLWEKGYELFVEMEKANVARDVVTYNAVLDAVATEIKLGRKLFQEGVKKGFYARVSRLGSQWFELDLHFLSLGGGEIALGWWFEECMMPYLMDPDKLHAVSSISIVTGYGKTRTRGRRAGDDGMKKRVQAMLKFMNIREMPQQNAGRITINKEFLIEEVKKNGGKVTFDLAGYVNWKEKETTANVIPDVPQKIRARFRPEAPKSGRPPFRRVESESTSPEYMLKAMRASGHDRTYSVASPVNVIKSKPSDFQRDGGSRGPGGYGMRGRGNVEGRGFPGRGRGFGDRGSGHDSYGGDFGQRHRGDRRDETGGNHGRNDRYGGDHGHRNAGGPQSWHQGHGNRGGYEDRPRGRGDERGAYNNIRGDDDFQANSERRDSRPRDHFNQGNQSDRRGQGPRNDRGYHL